MNFFETSYKSVGHFIARQFSTLNKFVVFANAHKAALASGLDKVAHAAEFGEALSGHPELVALTEASRSAGQMLLGKAFEVINMAGLAADAKGASLPLDQATIAGLKDLFKQAEALVPGSTVPPAGLPLETASKVA